MVVIPQTKQINLNGMKDGETVNANLNVEIVNEPAPLFYIPNRKKSEHPKVSVIVPVYKVDRYLTKCLNSIVHQTMDEIEIIVVDEGDYDRCREIIDYFAKKDPRIVAPHQKNGGYGSSCNLGIRMAKGKYISIIESDDYIHPEMCERMYDYAERLGADVVKAPYIEHLQGGDRECPFRARMAESLPSFKLFSMKEFGEMLEIHAALWSGLYKTEYLRQKNIYFVEAKGAAYVDVGFRISTLINTERVAWLDEAFYYYRVDSEGSSSNNFKLMTMAQRWNEQHKAFGKENKDYENYYGPHLILDEYLNTIGWLSLISATDEEFEKISENMNYIPEEMVNSSKILNSSQKSDILLYKKDPNLFKKQANHRRALRRINRKITPVLDKFTNPVLLMWFVSIAIISFIVKSSFQTLNSIFRISHSVLVLLDALSLIGLVGIIVCCLSKLIRKIYISFLRQHKKHKGEL